MLKLRHPLRSFTLVIWLKQVSRFASLIHNTFSRTPLLRTLTMLRMRAGQPMLSHINERPIILGIPVAVAYAKQGIFEIVYFTFRIIDISIYLYNSNKGLRHKYSNTCKVIEQTICFINNKLLFTGKHQ